MIKSTLVSSLVVRSVGVFARQLVRSPRGLMNVLGCIVLSSFLYSRLPDSGCWYTRGLIVLGGTAAPRVRVGQSATASAGSVGEQARALKGNRKPVYSGF